MKKQLCFFIFFIYFGFVHSQSIEGTITYLASSKKAVEFVQNDKDKNRKQTVSELYKKAKDVNSVLRFNNQLSEYYVIDKMDITSNEVFNFTYVMAGSESKYYTYNNVMTTKNKTLNCHLLDECFLIKNEEKKWILTQESRKIQGFLAYKALIKNPRNNKIVLEAWYTPEIPYQYGVMDLYGLPGLILEVNRNTFSMKAIRIELNPNQPIKIKEPKGIKEVSQKEFKVLTRKAIPGFFKN